jgi:hypothetical protein
MEGLNDLTSVGDFLLIYCSDLNSLTGLENLSSIGGYFYLDICSNLTNLSGLESLSSIGDYFWVYGCDSLTNLTGLENLTFIGGGLKIASNSYLANLEGLENLDSIGGTLTIHDNIHLTTLLALNNVTSIGGSVRITYNPLVSLSGLDNIDAGSITNLYIFNNDSLSTCEVQSICDYLVSPNGEIEIHDNAPGCNSHQEVEIACVVGIEDTNIMENYLNFYPNPSSFFIVLETNNNGRLSILDLTYKEIIIQTINERQTLLDISNLISSVYILRYQNGNTVQIRKLIKN